MYIHTHCSTVCTCTHLYWFRASNPTPIRGKEWKIKWFRDTICTRLYSINVPEIKRTTFQLPLFLPLFHLSPSVPPPLHTVLSPSPPPSPPPFPSLPPLTPSFPPPYQYSSIYTNVSMANMSTIHPMCIWSSRERGVAKLEKVSPS